MAQAEVAQGRERSARSLDLLLALWRLVGSAQFALVLIGFLALAGLLAVVLPQIPETLRGNPAAVAAWVELQKGTFGPLTEPMRWLGLFNVVAAWWFLAALGLLAVSVVVYMTNRLPSVWRNVTKPQQRVPDSFFDRAANRVAFTTAEASGEAEAASRLGALLRRRDAAGLPHGARDLSGRARGGAGRCHGERPARLWGVSLPPGRLLRRGRRPPRARCLDGQHALSRGAGAAGAVARARGHRP